MTKRVLTFGTFDRLHPGHIHYLSHAQTLGDLWVVVGRDAHVRDIKGRLPEQNEDERAEAIRQAFPGAHVQLGDPEDYAVPLVAIQPDLIVLGYDQKLPPGISESDLPCPVIRAEAFNPEEFKSSLRRTA